MAGKDGEQDVVNPAYLRWIKQDQLIMSLIISSLSEETIPIVIGLPTKKSIWDALEASFSSPSNTRILNLHMQLHNLKQEDLSITQYLHKVKLLIDELAAAGRPVCLPDQNIYMFKGLRSEFKDIVTALFARQEPVTFSELHSLLLSHEFIHASVLPRTRANTTSKITEDEVATTREVEEEIVVADNVLATIRPLEISGPHWTLARVVKFVMRYNHTINQPAYLTHQSPYIAPQNWYPDSGASHHDNIQGSSTPLKDKDEALETPRRTITRSQTKEFNDKLNGLQSLIQRCLIREEELKPKGKELSKCYNYLVAQIQAQDEEF
ncbi:hypothetical protein KY285_010704 [Solanum tuberosum]|nr:hypothetical protein KY289_013106 [Solanum tuberosum]KAH0734997.1 hypothetical protein KY285_010704 [Solanum tuberosum]